MPGYILQFAYVKYELSKLLLILWIAFILKNTRTSQSAGNISRTLLAFSRLSISTERELNILVQQSIKCLMEIFPQYFSLEKLKWDNFKK